jgi:predicted acylesterase/phospholipase RssA
MTTGIVIGSGGIKGFLYIGGLKSLEEKGVIEACHHYFGCSVGALISLLLCSGMTVGEVLAIFLTKKFEDVMVFGSWDSIVSGVGMFDNSVMKTHLCQILGERLRIDDVSELTFKMLYQITKKELYTVTVDTDNMKVKTFGTRCTPDVSVVTAVVASCSIPFVIQGTDLGGEFAVDGAVMDPVGLQVAFNYLPRQSTIHCLFLANPLTANKFGRVYGDVDVNTRSPPRRAPAPQMGVAANFLSHAQRVFRCFMESLVENYIYRYLYENVARGLEMNIHLHPLPNLYVNFACDAETQAKMYFLGMDIVKKYLKESVCKDPINKYDE